MTDQDNEGIAKEELLHGQMRCPSMETAHNTGLCSNFQLISALRFNKFKPKSL
jgi:hypothetical protein